MCYKYKRPEDKTQTEVEFDARFSRPEYFNPSKDIVNGFDYPMMPIILDSSPNLIIEGQWKLIPPFAKSDNPKEYQANTLNARIEELRNKPSWKDSADNRCLILAQSIIEYHHIDVPGKKAPKTVPYEIWRQCNKPMGIAGIYNMRSGVPTYSMVMTDANALMATVHNSAERMPVILEGDEYLRWLTGEDELNFVDRSLIELQAIMIGDSSEEQLTLF
ncbi:SOS response-associated peptidase [Flavobacterium hauense]